MRILLALVCSHREPKAVCSHREPTQAFTYAHSVGVSCKAVDVAAFTAAAIDRAETIGQSIAHEQRERMAVILHHFTFAKFLPSIEESGLLPGTDPEKSSPILTLGIPVVWLTSNPTEIHWMLNVDPNAGHALITVDAKKKHLRHWRTWMEGLEGRLENGEIVRGADVLSVLDSRRDDGDWNAQIFLECCRDFYVHLGPISRRRIKSVHPVEWEIASAELEQMVAA